MKFVTKVWYGHIITLQYFRLLIFLISSAFLQLKGIICWILFCFYVNLGAAAQRQMIEDAISLLLQMTDYFDLCPGFQM